MNELTLRSVGKGYGENTVLNGFSYSFPQGKVTSVMGPSGEGKTTLLKIIAGLEQPDSGSVSGRPERIAYVFQEDRLAEDFSAVSNVAAAAAKGVSRKEIERELASVGIRDFKTPVRVFSGGMKRRVAIVRAMVNDAELVLLDEPFKGLDKELRDTVMDYVLEKTEGKTVVFVTHDPDEAARMGGSVITLG